MADQHYRITSAILTKRRNGFVWTLTFTPLPAKPGAPFDPDGTKDIVRTVPSGEIDNMTFDVTYTRDEIDTLPTT